MRERVTGRTVPPEGIVITISKGMIGDKGYRHWLRNFLDAMRRSETDDSWYYWFRQGNVPKHEVDLQYVYLCIGNKIRYRVYFAGSRTECVMHFDDGRSMRGKAWLAVAGPVHRAPHVIKRQGFQGFRYTEKLF